MKGHVVWVGRSSKYLHALQTDLGRGLALLESYNLPQFLSESYNLPQFLSEQTLRYLVRDLVP